MGNAFARLMEEASNKKERTEDMLHALAHFHIQTIRAHKKALDSASSPMLKEFHTNKLREHQKELTKLVPAFNKIYPMDFDMARAENLSPEQKAKRDKNNRQKIGTIIYSMKKQRPENFV